MCFCHGKATRLRPCGLVKLLLQFAVKTPMIQHESRLRVVRRYLLQHSNRANGDLHAFAAAEGRAALMAPPSSCSPWGGVPPPNLGRERLSCAAAHGISTFVSSLESPTRSNELHYDLLNGFPYGFPMLVCSKRKCAITPSLACIRNLGSQPLQRCYTALSSVVFSLPTGEIYSGEILRKISGLSINLLNRFTVIL